MSRANDHVDFFEVNGRMYPVSGYVHDKKGQELPIVDIPMMSDYKWKLKCLESRLQHPDAYAPYEDVEATITRLRAWLEAHATEGKEKTA